MRSTTTEPAASCCANAATASPNVKQTRAKTTRKFFFTAGLRSNGLRTKPCRLPQLAALNCDWRFAPLGLMREHAAPKVVRQRLPRNGWQENFPLDYKL